MKQIYYITILLSWMLIGCENKSVSTRLAIIDSLIVAEKNDSAFQLVRSLDNRDIINLEDRAHYNLLMVQTGFLTNQPLSSDSLLDAAIAFYQENNDSERLADAYYYKGASRFYANDSIESMLYYKKAEDKAKGGSINQRYKIAEGISFINSVSGKYELALIYAKHALELSKAINNRRWLADAYYRVGISYSNLGLADSAIFYFEKTEPYIKYINKKDKPYFLSNLGLAYMDKNSEKAKQYILEALSYKETTRPLEYLAEIEYEEGHQEEAYRLWERAITINDRTPKDNILHNLLEYNIEHGKTEEICEQVNEIINIKDSIIHKLRNDTIKDLQIRFDHQVEVNAANERLIHWQWLLGGFILIVICLIGYILWKKHKIHLLQMEYEVQKREFLYQIQEQEIAFTKAENQIMELKSTNAHNQMEIKELEVFKADAETMIENLKDDKTLNIQKIEELENAKANAERQIQDINHIQSQNIQRIVELEQTRELAQKEVQEMERRMQKWQGKEADKIRKGVILYDDLVNNKKVLEWTADDYEALIDYYEIGHYSVVKKIRRENPDVTQRNMLYLILVEMGKTNKEISKIMSIDSQSIRSVRFRLRKKRMN